MSIEPIMETALIDGHLVTTNVPVIPASTGLQSQSPQQKLAEFIGDVLNQLSFLQGVISTHITEIAALQEKNADLEERVLQCEAFKKAIKLRLRQQTESPL